MFRSSFPVLMFLAVSGCAHATSKTVANDGVSEANRSEAIRHGCTTIHLQYDTSDESAALQIKRVLPRAIGIAERWGHFSAPIRLTLHPSHQSLEKAACRHGYPWLRAWARYATLDLQSPRTWSRGSATDAELEQLLVHEFSHLLLYQVTASASTWGSAGIPVWFQEGMACVTSGQKRKQARMRTVGRFFLEKATGRPLPGDPLSEPEPLYRTESELVYGTAHEAFHLLLTRYGEERVRHLFRDMAEEQPFPQAFQDAFGVSVQDFEDEFRHHAQQWATTTTSRARRDL